MQRNFQKTRSGKLFFCLIIEPPTSNIDFCRETNRDYNHDPPRISFLSFKNEYSRDAKYLTYQYRQLVKIQSIGKVAENVETLIWNKLIGFTMSRFLFDVN